jgi:hypothetical protein
MLRLTHSKVHARFNDCEAVFVNQQTHVRIKAVDNVHALLTLLLNALGEPLLRRPVK